jgi:hypothetical protein
MPGKVRSVDPGLLEFTTRQRRGGKHVADDGDIARERAEYELKKLKAEVRQMESPWRHWSTVVAWVTVGLAIVGTGLQCASSRRENQLAEIQLERAQRDLREVQDQRLAAENALLTARAIVDNLGKQRRSIEVQLVRLKQDIQSAKRARSAVAPASQGDSAIERISASADSLASLSRRSSRLTDSASVIIGDLAYRYSGGGPSRSRMLPNLSSEPAAAWLYLELSSRTIIRVTYFEPNLGELVYQSDSTGDEAKMNIGLRVGGKLRVDGTNVATRTTISRVVNCQHECTVKF